MANFDYSKEPRCAILFEDVKSNYASIECQQLGLDPLTTSLCVMSRADNSSGLILAASPTFKRVFGQSNVGHSRDLPFYPWNRKFNYRRWYDTHTDFNGVRTEPTPEYVTEIERWARNTYIVPPQMGLYIKYNIQVNKILAEITSMQEVHPYSIDEAFLDVTESLDFFFPDEKDYYKQIDLMAKKLQLEIYHRTGLYITVGMGDNPLLAKLAMDNYAKKNKNMRALIRYEDVEIKVWTIPEMTDFWGIGEATKKNLSKLGIHSIKELANFNPDILKRKMGVLGVQLYCHANGIDESNVHDIYIRKSVSFGNSQVLPRDYIVQGQIEIVLKEMVEQVAVRLRKAKKEATNFSFFIGFSNNEYRNTIHLSRKCEPTNSTHILQNEVIRLFRERYDEGAVRNIGFSANNLIDEPYHLISLFDEDKSNKEIERQQKEERIQEALDTIRQKQGFTAVQKATVLKYGSRAVARSKLIGGHSAGGLAGLE